MSHEPIDVTICISDLNKAHYWKTNDGKVMLTVKVAERQKPSEKGMTHYVKIYDKVAKESTYCGYGKFAPFTPKEVSDRDLPPGADDIEDAVVVSDLPF